MSNPSEGQDDGYEGGCQNCGRLIDKGAKGYDDIVSAPYATESGDLYCIPCGRAQDQADREQAEQDYYDEDPNV
jgi:hypothetical protein